MNWLTLFSLVSIVFSFFLLGIAVYRNVKNWRTHDDHDTPPVGLEVRTSLLLVVYSVTGVYGYVNKLAFENPMYWRGLTALIVVHCFLTVTIDRGFDGHLEVDLRQYLTFLVAAFGLGAVLYFVLADCCLLGT